MSLNPGSLAASLIWGSVGMGFLIYGKKQTSIPALFGGLALIGISYFIDSALWMTLAALAIIAAIYFVTRRG